MEKTTKNHYDLEERTFQFAKNVRVFAKKLPRTRQLFFNIFYLKIMKLFGNWCLILGIS